MVEDHRRVEPREMAVGMRSDPERIQQLIDERARRERASRERPKHSFGEVLAEVPAEPEEEAEETSEAEPSEEEAPAEVELPRTPPDPRAAALHRMLEKKAAK